MKRKVLGFESLEVWQLFLVYNRIVYKSIKARDHWKEKIQFFNIAKSSVNEVTACLLIIQNLECEGKTYVEINLLIENLNILNAKLGKFKKYFESKLLK